MGTDVAVAEEMVDIEVDTETVSLDWLETELTTMAARIAAATATWLGWVAVYDRRNGWERWGCRSMAGWLNWKCGMSIQAAHEHVRVARALEELPLTRDTFAKGELSYSKVRAITRIATADMELDLMNMALACDAAALERICAAVRRAERLSDPDQTEKNWADRKVTSRNNGDGTVTVSATMPVAEAEQIVSAIDGRVDDIIDTDLDTHEDDKPARREVIAARGGLAAMRLDALHDLVVNESSDVELSVIVDADTLTSAQGEPSSAEDTCEIAGEHIEPEIARRLGCDAAVVALIEDDDGTPVGVGTKKRTVNRRVRRALERRDRGMCRFHGCGATRGLHAHHIIHWAHGGPTELHNLILLCGFHHHLVHEGGWNIDTDAYGRHHFVTPDGDIVGVPVFRGRLEPLPEAPSPHVLGMNAKDRVDDLAWITVIVLHNRTCRQRDRLAAA